jgi:UDP-N-acetylglucosamine 1-carboxyvinyltransferase
MRYKIIGGHKLEGKVQISGSKNSVFPCVAAALLTSETVILENVSHLKDPEVLIQILKQLGVSVEQEKSTLTIKASDIRKFSLPENLMVKLRGSIVLVGAILGRIGRVNFYHPGGDIIGRRSIETHLEGFKQLGVTIKKNNLKYSLMVTKKQENYDIFLNEASVTATENLILISVVGNSRVTLRNCAKEPHIVDLCRMLTFMGSQIEGIGTATLKITGVSKLKGTRFRISADYLEIGTYIIASAITGGQI